MVNWKIVMQLILQHFQKCNNYDTGLNETDTHPATCLAILPQTHQQFREMHRKFHETISCKSRDLSYNTDGQVKYNAGFTNDGRYMPRNTSSVAWISWDWKKKFLAITLDNNTAIQKHVSVTRISWNRSEHLCQLSEYGLTSTCNTLQVIAESTSLCSLSVALVLTTCNKKHKICQHSQSSTSENRQRTLLQHLTPT